MYSFSFAPNRHWSRRFSGQAEIWDYTRRCFAEFDIARHVRCISAVVSSCWDENTGLWHVATAQGEQWRCRALIWATGALSRPTLPQLPGQASFLGPAFHSARWDHTCDLRGKRVAVIGTGASAIQFVPQIAPLVAHLDVYQRTPPWIVRRKIGHLARGRAQRLPACPGLCSWGGCGLTSRSKAARGRFSATRGRCLWWGGLPAATSRPKCATLCCAPNCCPTTPLAANAFCCPTTTTRRSRCRTCRCTPTALRRSCRKACATAKALSCVHPGGIQTNIVRASRYGADLVALWGDAERNKAAFEAQFLTTADKAAATILRGVACGDRRILVGQDATAIDWLVRWLPVRYQDLVLWHVRRQRKKLGVV